VYTLCLIRWRTRLSLYRWVSISVIWRYLVSSCCSDHKSTNQLTKIVIQWYLISLVFLDSLTHQSLTDLCLNIDTALLDKTIM